jgi:hypothetical protein
MEILSVSMKKFNWQLFKCVFDIIMAFALVVRKNRFKKLQIIIFS